MPVPTSITDLSTTAASNSPAGSDSVFPSLDDYLRSHASFIAQIHTLLRGCILTWKGAVVDIPSGWQLCDGTNGTPNLRDRFIVGAGSNYAVGATGGSDSVTLTAAQIPSHSHSFSASTSTGGNHAHGTTYAGDHSHTVYASNSTGGVTSVKAENRVSAAEMLTGSPTTVAGGHTHTTDAQGNHAHSVSGTTGAAGSDGSHENRPPYYALAYIAYVGV